MTKIRKVTKTGINSPVYGGTDKRILFIEGTNLSQDVNLNWDYSTETLILGSGETGVDYDFLKVDGETNDLTMTWLEDEETLQMNGSIYIPDGTGGIPVEGTTNQRTMILPAYNAIYMGSPQVSTDWDTANVKGSSIVLGTGKVTGEGAAIINRVFNSGGGTITVESNSGSGNFADLVNSSTGNVTAKTSKGSLLATSITNTSPNTFEANSNGLGSINAAYLFGQNDTTAITLRGSSGSVTAANMTFFSPGEFLMQNNSGSIMAASGLAGFGWGGDLTISQSSPGGIMAIDAQVLGAGTADVAITNGGGSLMIVDLNHEGATFRNLNGSLLVGQTTAKNQTMRTGTRSVAIGANIDGGTYTETFTFGSDFVVPQNQQFTVVFSGDEVWHGNLNEFVINESSRDMDFRVETNASANAFFINGGSDTVNIQSDATKLTLGAGNDLEIYHNGTNSIIDNQTGDLQINGVASSEIVINEDSLDCNFRVESNNVTNALLVDAGTDTVQTNTGVIRKTNRLTGNTTLDSTYHHVFCDTDGGAFTVTLPAGVAGTEYRIINTGSSNLTITPNGSELLLGSNSSFTLTTGEALLIVYESTEGWY